MSRPPGKWIRRLAGALIAIGAVLLVMGWIAREWIIPAYIRGSVARALGEVWNGSVTIREVRFRYFSPTELTGVRIEDDRGGQWLEAATVRVRLRDWPGLSPAIDDVDVDRLHVHFHESPPIRRPAAAAAPVSPDGGPRRVRVHSLVVSATYGGQRVNLEEMRVAVDRRDDHYTLLIESLPTSRDRLVLRASLAPGSGRVEAEAHIDRSITPPQFAAVRQTLALSAPLADGQAHVVGMLQFRGTLGQSQSYHVAADVRLTDGSMTLLEGVAVRGLRADLKLSDGLLRLSDVSCLALGGRVEAAGKMDWREGALVCEARAAVAALDLGAFAEALKLDVIRAGTVNGELTIGRGPGEPLRVRGEGDIRADLRAGPVQTVRGPVEFDLRSSGDPAGPLSLQGQVVLKGWTASAATPLATDLEVSLAFDGRQITLEHASAGLAGGAMTASGRIVLPAKGAGRSAELAASLAFQDVHTERMVEALGLSAGLPDGRITLRADLQGDVGRISRLRVSGDASVTPADGPHRLAGVYDVTLSGLGGGEAMRIDGSLTDWVLNKGERRRLGLKQVTLKTRDGVLAVEDAVLETDGGEVHAKGSIRRDHRGDVSHQWEFSCRGFDVAALMDWQGRRPVTRLNLEGVLGGRGAERLTAQAEGRVQAGWPDQPLDASAGVRLDLSLEDWRKARPLERMTVNMDLTGGLLRDGEERVVTDLAGRVRLAPGGPGSAHLTGSAVGGHFTADLQAGLPEGKWRYVGQAQVSGVDLGRLPEGLWRPAWLQSTSISGEFKVEGDGFSSPVIRAKGSAMGSFNSAAGWKIAGDYAFEGRLRGLGSTGPVGVHGRGRLTGLKGHNSYGAVAEDVRCSIRAFGRSVDVGGVRGTLLGGQAQGLLRLDFPPDKPMSLLGRLAMDDLELSALAKALGNEQPEVAGTVDFAYRFSAPELLPAAVRGRGVLEVRDSRMGGVPLVHSLLAAVRAEPAAASETDLNLVFDNAGTVVTVTGGSMTTPLAAISPVPGGTVNLATRELDLHVVAGLLADIDELVKVPFLELIMPFTRQLLRLHVTGTWDSHQTIHIRKEPLQDVGSATLQLFKGAVETGGELGAILVQPAREALP